MRITEHHPGAAAPAIAMTAATLQGRIAAIDAMRGFVMLVMLVDHVRETFFLHMQVSDPMDIAATPPALFFTRLFAHLCAPMFVFLTGLSAWLYAHPAAGPRNATGFLLKRGLLLVLLELGPVNCAWSGRWPPQMLYLQVIWVIGLAMIALALLHRLPLRLLAPLAVLIVAGHNAIDGLRFEPGGAAQLAWTVLKQRGYLQVGDALTVKISYPLLPWIGIILLGYVCGPLYAAGMDEKRRRRLLCNAGAAALLLLALLRGPELYGEPVPWQQGATALQTVMSFVNFTKYPPSLDFALMTLGLGALALAWMETATRRYTDVLATFGGAPMFYYLLHLYLLLALRKGLASWFDLESGQRVEASYVWQLWLIAFALVAVLYYPCRWFGAYKRRSTQAWVRYL